MWHYVSWASWMNAIDLIIYHKLQGPVLISGETSRCKILQSLEPARLFVKLILSMYVMLVSIFYVLSQVLIVFNSQVTQHRASLTLGHCEISWSAVAALQIAVRSPRFPRSPPSFEHAQNKLSDTLVTQDGDLASICKIGQIAADRNWVVVRSHRAPWQRCRSQ